MTWVRLADDFYDHPKVIEAGPMATLLWVCGIAYANRYLTDGYLPAASVRRLTDLDDPFRLAAKLVDVRLWEKVEGGYRIHDYGNYQPSAGAVREERVKNAERVAEWRDRQRNARSNGVRPAVGNAISPASPGPTPYPLSLPDPAGSTSPQPPPPAEGAEGTTTTDLIPLSDDDQLLWARAQADAADGILPANAERIAALEALGRGPDGAMRLRAPPGWGDLTRFVGTVRGALIRAGDQAGGRAVIVTG